MSVEKMKSSPAPFPLGAAHLVGIGGIGMSGIGEIMINLGYRVQGSDVQDSANMARLRQLGARVHVGHSASAVEGAGAVVVSSAIGDDNVEVQAARAAGIPVVHRADMLAEIIRLKWTVAIAGTHGKTTTTSMVAALLDGAGIDPTVINGGIVNAYGSNAKAGSGDWIVLEADESDGTFTKIRPTIAVVTNMDPEHMEHYGGMTALRTAFDTYVGHIPFYGFGVLCTDHPEVSAMVARVSDRRIVTYGCNPGADIRAVNLSPEADGMRFDAILRVRGGNGERTIGDIFLPMAGKHNVSNALAAIAVADALGITDSQIVESFRTFGGVKRRFTRIGTWNGVRFVDDYAHHPVEITACLQAARALQGKRRLIAVSQPHRYSRLRDLFADFTRAFRQADIAVITPVYPAGEAPLEGFDHNRLVAGMTEQGHGNAIALDDIEMLPDLVRDLVRSGDMVVFMGAGSISAYANRLVEQLQAGK